uniref:Uncharacterized protein n=1 Tax=Sphaerodactylus townsendi TaxID=933632 RepID=A0ACB8ERD4_9SAUR
MPIILVSDKIGMAERTGKQVGTGGGQQIRETVLLAVSSATLTILLLLTVFCAAAIYYCTKPYGYIDDFSLTSSEKRALLCPSDSSYSRTEDSSLLWNERLITIQGSSDPRQPTFSAYIDEVSTFSDESARTAERDITEAQYRLAPYQATPPSAKAEPPSVRKSHQLEGRIEYHLRGGNTVEHAPQLREQPHPVLWPLRMVPPQPPAASPQPLSLEAPPQLKGAPNSHQKHHLQLKELRHQKHPLQLRELRHQKHHLQLKELRHQKHHLQLKELRHQKKHRKNLQLKKHHQSKSAE